MSIVFKNNPNSIAHYKTVCFYHNSYLFKKKNSSIESFYKLVICRQVMVISEHNLRDANQWS